MSDASEVELLRARVAELEAQLTAGTAAGSRGDEQRAPKWRGALGALLIVVGCVLAPLSVASVWASSQLSDTDRYIETVAPLANDAAVQQALSDAVTQEIFARIDVEALTDEALKALAKQDALPSRVASALPSLAMPISSGIESFTRSRVDEALASDRFVEVWAQVNRVAHDQVVRLLEGDTSGAVSAQDNAITLNLAPIIEEVKKRLVEQGFSLAGSIPAVNKSFVLVQSDSITQAQGFYRLLNTLGTWLPVVALLFVAVGVAVAVNRRRALIGAALGIAVSMILLGLLLAIARALYVGTVPGGVLTPDAAGQIFDMLVRFLRTGIRAVAVLALIVALGAFLTGSSDAALRTRSTFARGIGSLRGSAESAGWNAGRVGTWTYAHKRVLRIAAVVVGAVALAFWSQPTGFVVIVVAVLVAIALAVIEFLGRPAPTHPDDAAPSDPRPSPM